MSENPLRYPSKKEYTWPNAKISLEALQKLKSDIDSMGTEDIAKGLVTYRDITPWSSPDMQGVNTMEMFGLYQRACKLLGDNTINVDCRFGGMTSTAIRKMQEKLGVPVDGFAWTTTTKALIKKWSPLSNFGNEGIHQRAPQLNTAPSTQTPNAAEEAEKKVFQTRLSDIGDLRKDVLNKVASPEGKINVRFNPMELPRLKNFLKRDAWTTEYAQMHDEAKDVVVVWWKLEWMYRPLTLIDKTGAVILAKNIDARGNVSYELWTPEWKKLWAKLKYDPDENQLAFIK